MRTLRVGGWSNGGRWAKGWTLPWKSLYVLAWGPSTVPTTICPTYMRARLNTWCILTRICRLLSFRARCRDRVHDYAEINLDAESCHLDTIDKNFLWHRVVKYFPLQNYCSFDDCYRDYVDYIPRCNLDAIDVSFLLVLVIAIAHLDADNKNFSKFIAPKLFLLFLSIIVIRIGAIAMKNYHLDIAE